MPRFWKLIPKPWNGRRVLAEGDPNSSSLTPVPSLEGSKAPGTQLVTLKWILQGGLCRRAEGSCLSSHTRATDWGGHTWLHGPPSAGGKLNRASENFHLFQHQMRPLTHDLQCLFQTSHSVLSLGQATLPVSPSSPREEQLTFKVARARASPPS